MDSDELLNFAELDAQIQDIIDRSELLYNLKIQIEEVDFLRAMYYQSKEFVVDENVLKKVNEYVTETSSEIPPTLDFVINLCVKNLSAEVHVTLPKQYPNLPPKIYLRSNQLSRNQQNSVNNDLETFLHSLDRGTICVYECISWIIDNILKYLPKEKPKHEVNRPAAVQRELFTRYWLYSHHIYSKEKRREILALSSKYHVTGFCLSGKPGIICGEGFDKDCNEWWQHVRYNSFLGGFHIVEIGILLMADIQVAKCLR